MLFGSYATLVLLLPLLFQTGGTITWDFHISSVPVYANDGSGSGAASRILAAVCIALLAINMLLEVYGEPNASVPRLRTAT